MFVGSIKIIFLIFDIDNICFLSLLLTRGLSIIIIFTINKI